MDNCNSCISYTWYTYLSAFGRSIVTRNVKKRFNSIEESYKKSLSQDENILNEVKDKDIYIYNQFHYLSNHEGYPVYKNTDIEFYSIGEEGLEAQLKELEKAEKFIFMEYHAIEEASSFDRIKDVLIKRLLQALKSVYSMMM